MLILPGCCDLPVALTLYGSCHKPGVMGDIQPEPAEAVY